MPEVVFQWPRADCVVWRRSGSKSSLSGVFCEFRGSGRCCGGLRSWPRPHVRSNNCVAGASVSVLRSHPAAGGAANLHAVVPGTAIRGANAATREPPGMMVDESEKVDGAKWPRSVAGRDPARCDPQDGFFHAFP